MKGMYCKYCQQSINEKAKVCRHCGKDQRWWINIIQFAASSIAIVMVLIAVEQLVELKKKRVEAEVVLSQAKNVLINASTSSAKAIEKANYIFSNVSTRSNNLNIKLSKQEQEAEILSRDMRAETLKQILMTDVIAATTAGGIDAIGKESDAVKIIRNYKPHSSNKRLIGYLKKVNSLNPEIQEDLKNLENFYERGQK